MAPSVVCGAGSIGLDAVGSIAMPEDDVTIRVAAMVKQYSEAPINFMADLNVDETSTEGARILHLMAGRPPKRILSGPIEVKSVGNDAASVTGIFKSKTSIDFTGKIGIIVKFPTDTWGGGTWQTDSGFSGTMPETYEKFPLGEGRCRRMEFLRKDGRSFAVEFPEEVSVSAFDVRRYGGTGTSIRFMTNLNTKPGKDENIAISCRIVRAGGLSVRHCRTETISPGDEWIPFKYILDIAPGSALDFSRMEFHDAPAGKHGWLKAVCGHFEFEGKPGVSQRFNGVNLTGDATCPDKKIADKLVTRLVRLGYNSIRIHHHEKPIMRESADGIAFDEDALDRMDYLIFKAIEAGLYITTDLFVSRPVSWKSIGEDRKGKLSGNVYKSLLVLGHPGAMESWARFAKAWLTHINPYTKRSLAEEPALITLGLVNEGHLGMGWSRVKDMPVAQKAWERWLNGRVAADFGLPQNAVPSCVKDINKNTDDTIYSMFAADLEREKVNAMTMIVRSTGCRALLFNDNNGPKYAARQFVRNDFCDLVDVHIYVDHPHFIGANWRMPVTIEGANPFHAQRYAFAAVCAERLYTKPFTSTEWAHASVSPYRSTAGLLGGAVAAGQDWSGMWRFAYAQGAKCLNDDGGKVASFDLGGDPLKQAADRTFALLFLRGDVPVLKDRMMFGVSKQTVDSRKTKAVRMDLPMWARRTMFETRLGSVVAGERSLENGAMQIERVVSSEKAPKSHLSEKPCVNIDWKRGSFSVVTPMTCGGFAEAGENVAAGALMFAVSGHRATVSASSLDGRPLASSSHILVTHLTDVLGEGARFANKQHTVVLSYGNRGAPLMRAGSTKIVLSLDVQEAGAAGESHYRVYALDTAGRREMEIPLSIENGRLMFTAEVKQGRANMYYEVIRR